MKKPIIENYIKIFNFLYNFLFKVLYLKLFYRRFILLSLDILIIFFSLLIIDFSFKYNFRLINDLFIFLFPISIIFYSITGQYKSITRYISSLNIYTILVRNFILLIIFFIINKLFYLSNLLNFNIIVLLWIIINFFMVNSRIYIKDFISYLNATVKKDTSNVAIYGVGRSGAQLASSLSLNSKYKIKFFIDDDSELSKRRMLGLPIYPLKKINDFKNQIDTVLFAIHNINKKRKLEIFNDLQSKSIKVLQVPSIEKLESGDERIDTLRPIAIEDILSREISINKEKSFINCINGSVVCVTGAGGSIGSELCTQIINLNPKLLILLEWNEHNLYKIKNKLLNKKIDLKIKPILGNACDKNLLEIIFEKYNVNTVFHAAAHKHVTIVEENPIEGIYNNIFSTLEICELAYKSEVESLIYISTDKAVRPTNLMGATKRLSEIIVKYYANEIKKNQLNNKKFSIVRFGNVLGSSGSVVPLFKKQIKNGGPVTVTDEAVVRYFMTIPEAVELVLEAANLSKGGEVFLLDMGEPVKILELAKQMIKLSGLKVKDENNLDGDIEIIFTGLKPGEKLFEELIIDAKSEKTKNPLIFKANEKGLEKELLLENLQLLKLHVEKRDIKKSIKIISNLVQEWQKSTYYQTLE